MSQGKLISEQVICCAFEVSNTLGAGFIEKVYENALCVELNRAGIPFCRQKRYDVRYKNENIGNYIADIVIADKLLVELKALSALNKEHEAQVMNYLRSFRAESWVTHKFWNIKNRHEADCLESR